LQGSPSAFIKESGGGGGGGGGASASAKPAKKCKEAAAKPRRAPTADEVGAFVRTAVNREKRRAGPRSRGETEVSWREGAALG
jgi:hypothetical protein